MRRRAMAMSTGLILLAVGAGAVLFWPHAATGRLLTDSDLAKVRGLDPDEKGNTVAPVGCEAWNIGAGQVTPQQCVTQGGGFGKVCEVCSDKIGTVTGVSEDGPGAPQDLDGNYQCSGQKSTAPCTGAAGSGQCGTYMVLDGVFCTTLIPDYDPQ